MSFQNNKQSGAQSKRSELFFILAIVVLYCTLSTFKRTHRKGSARGENRMRRLHDDRTTALALPTVSDMFPSKAPSPI